MKFFALLLILIGCINPLRVFGAANDYVTNAIILPGNTSTFFGSLYGATRDQSEPSLSSSSTANMTVWYKWIAPTNGAYFFQSRIGSSFSEIFAYKTNLWNVTLENESKTGMFYGREGKEYLIAICGYNYERYPFGYNILPIPAAPHLIRVFTPWTDFTPHDFFYEVDVAGAEPLNYTWFQDGQLIEGQNSSVLASYSYNGTLNGTNISVLASNEFGTISYSFPGPGTGPPPHPNANITNATPLSGSHVLASGRVNDSASAEPRAWWKWTAPTAGWYKVEADGQPVFRGTLASEPTEMKSSQFYAEPSEEIYFGFSPNFGSELALAITPLLPWPRFAYPPEKHEGFNPAESYSLSLEGLLEGVPPIHVEWFINGTLTQSGTNQVFQFSAPESTNQLIVSVLASNAWGYGSAKILTLYPAPPNDDFANRTILPAGSNYFRGTALGATLEPEEGSSFFQSLHGSVWFEWTAPETGLYQFGTCDEVLVYTPGTNLVDLKLIGGGKNLAVVPVISGNRYVICFMPGIFSSVTRNYKFVAIKSDGKPLSHSLEIVARQKGLDIEFYAETLSPSPVLYKWRRNGALVFSTYLDNLVVPNAGQSWAGEYSVTAENAYGITTGSVSQISAALAPNDDFRNARTITTGEEIAPENFGLTIETDEPLGTYLISSAWYKWVAPSNGFYQVQGTFDKFFVGTALSELKQLTQDTLLNAVGGTTYYLQTADHLPFKIMPGSPPAEIVIGGNSNAVSGASAYLSSDWFTGLWPAVFQWYKNNAPMPTGTGSYLDFAPASFDDAAEYFLEVHNVQGIFRSNPWRMQVHSPGALRIFPDSLTVHPSPSMEIDFGHFNGVVIEASSDLTNWMEAGKAGHPLFNFPYISFAPAKNNLPRLYYRLKGKY